MSRGDPAGLLTPYEVLRARRDRGRPLVTHYSGPDTRTELSVATAQNATAKAAGLLRDELGLQGGATVSVDLPPHWQLPIWVWAALSAGLTCARNLPGPVAARVVGPQWLATRTGPWAEEVLACSCDTFGLPIPTGVPTGVLDVGVEVRSQPDDFAPDPDARGAAVLVGGVARPWQQVPAGRPGARLWVDAATAEAALLDRVAIVPLLSGGSVVIGRALTEAQAARVRAVEGVG